MKIVIFARLLRHGVFAGYHMAIEAFGERLSRKHRKKAIHHLERYIQAGGYLKAFGRKK